MNISSRTPEGQSNTCPVCKSVVCIEPSLALENVRCSDAPCPNCGTLLWFVCGETGYRLYRAAQIEALANRMANAFGTIVGASKRDVASSKSFLDDLGADSLDTVELMMELESEWGIRISDDDAERLATVADAVAFLQTHVNRD
jgi:acyl carrier protein